jgi:serine phosphatase RsbU (regulator of sigma subunit)
MWYGDAQRVKGESLDAIAGRLNRILLDSMDASRFVTAFYGLLEPASGAIGFANCGHNPPLLLRAGGAREMLPSGGPALGMWREAAFAPGEAMLHRGDVLVLYTDGVVEVMSPSGELFGVDRLEAAVRRCADASSRERMASVVDATRAFAGHDGYDDDFTLVIVGREGPLTGTGR